MILYNSEKSIRDIRPFCNPLLCRNSVVKYTFTSYSSKPAKETWPPNITEIAPTKLTGCIRPSCYAVGRKCRLAKSYPFECTDEKAKWKVTTLNKNRWIAPDKGTKSLDEIPILIKHLPVMESRDPFLRVSSRSGRLQVSRLWILQRNGSVKLL